MNIASPTSNYFGQPEGILASAAHVANSKQMLALTGIKRKLSKGSTILHEEDDVKHVYEIVSGTVKTSKLLADGRRQVIGFFGAGDIIGLPFEFASFYSVEAVTQTTILCYPISQLHAVMGQSPELTKFVFSCVHNEQEKQIDHMISLGRKRPKERIASFLLDFYNKRVDMGFADQVIELPMSRVDISDYMGLTQETVCRVLSFFKRRAIITSRNSHEITILDLPSLERMAQSSVLH